MKPSCAAARMQEGGRALASPAVRRMAREYGLDVGCIAGSGPDGRVTKGRAPFCCPDMARLPAHDRQKETDPIAQSYRHAQSGAYLPASPSKCCCSSALAGDIMSVVEALAAGALPPPQDSAPTADAAMATPAAAPKATSGPAAAQQHEGDTVVALRHAMHLTVCHA